MLDKTGMKYINAHAPVYRLALGDKTSHGRRTLVCGTLDGRVCCIDPETEQMLWEFRVGGLPFSIKTCDINSDGKREILAACSDGCLYALGPDGNLLWQREFSLPLFDVAAGKSSSEDFFIACGGPEGKVVVLSSEGEFITDYDVDGYVHRLVTHDLDGDGFDEIFLLDRTTDAEVIKLKNRKLHTLWRKKLHVPKHMWNWENSFGYFHAMSVDIGPLTKDCRPAIILGDSFWNKQAVMALDAAGNTLWIDDSTKYKYFSEFQKEFFSTAFARIVRVPGDEDKKRIVTIAGNYLKLLNSEGKLIGESISKIGFTDAIIDGTNMYLGSSPNGDRTVYCLKLDEDILESFSSIERYGLPQEIGENIEKLRKQVTEYPKENVGNSVYRVRDLVFGQNENENAVLKKKLAWIKKQWPYTAVQHVASAAVRECSPPLDKNGKPWDEFRWSIDKFKPGYTTNEIIARTRWFEENQIPVVFGIGHSCMPFITLDTAEKMLRTAPNYLVGFQTAEDENMERIPRYFEEWFSPLQKLCGKHNNKMCLSSMKGTGWFSTPAVQGMCDILFAEGKPKNFMPVAEDSNSRTPELSLFGMMGLKLAGLTERFQVSLISDLFSSNRCFQWEYPKHGHPYLRLLVAQTVLGGTDYMIRFPQVTKNGEEFAFTDLAKESTDIFFHMLGKGIVFSPAPEQMIGVSSVGFAVHQPPDKWLREAHNGHHPNKWIEDKELRHAAFPFNGCTWGFAPTPEHAVQRVLLNKKEQFGYYIPPTPYGAFAIVPAEADLNSVQQVKEWWHTDGICVWREGGEKMTGMKAAGAVKSSFEKAAEKLPFRALGDDVFLQTLKIDDNTYRIFVIDPGWLLPKERKVTLKSQLPGQVQLSDLLSGEPIREREELTIPAGLFRIIEASVLSGL